jgi:hypothetical protein
MLSGIPKFPGLGEYGMERTLVLLGFMSYSGLCLLSPKSAQALPLPILCSFSCTVPRALDSKAHLGTRGLHKRGSLSWFL